MKIYITFSLRYSYALFLLSPVFSFFCVWVVYRCLYIYMFVCTCFCVNVQCTYECMCAHMHMEAKGIYQGLLQPFYILYFESGSFMNLTDSMGYPARSMNPPSHYPSNPSPLLNLCSGGN